VGRFGIRVAGRRGNPVPRTAEALVEQEIRPPAGSGPSTLAQVASQRPGEIVRA